MVAIFVTVSPSSSPKTSEIKEEMRLISYGSFIDKQLISIFTTGLM